MDHAGDDFDGNIFIYSGGRAPQHVSHVLIDKSLDEIEELAFYECCRNLVTVDTHDGIRRIGNWAFEHCNFLLRINLKSVVEIDGWAFYGCENLESVEFGDYLDTIGEEAFAYCTSLKHLKLPSIITIGVCAFYYCHRLTDVEFSERLETIGAGAFLNCDRLQRITIPLKRNLLAFDDDNQEYAQFDDCDQLTTVDLIGGIHETASSMHMESWRTEMIADINRINQVLPNTPADEKTEEIRQWMELLIDKMDHYKAEHCRYVKEGITLLELALWKAKLGEKEDNCGEGKKEAKVDAESYRRDKRITCGADMVIKNVLPFLQLE